MESTEKPVRKSKDTNAKKVQAINEEMRENRKKFAIVRDADGGLKQIER